MENGQWTLSMDITYGCVGFRLFEHSALGGSIKSTSCPVSSSFTIFAWPSLIGSKLLIFNAVRVLRKLVELV